MIEPMTDRIAVTVPESIEKTKGGIIIPTAAQEKSQQGTIVAVGPGRWDAGVFVPVTLRVGDEVLFGKYSGVEIEVDGEEVLILRESDVLARVPS